MIRKSLKVPYLLWPAKEQAHISSGHPLPDDAAEEESAPPRPRPPSGTVPGPADTNERIMRHPLTRPVPCSTTIRWRLISLFSAFCSSVNCPPRGFLWGVWISGWSWLQYTTVAQPRFVGDGLLSGALPRTAGCRPWALDVWACLPTGRAERQNFSVLVGDHLRPEPMAFLLLNTP